jgi:UDP-glucuronate 4-epimerase
LKILITGVAGFIGYHLTKRILAEGSSEVVGLDNINTYYDTDLKWGRLQQLGITPETAQPGAIVPSTSHSAFRFVRLHLTDEEAIDRLFQTERFDYVIHLAAQAGVRHSLEAPRSYVQSNVSGFLNILEGCRIHGVKHLIFASSSSVYGKNRKVPFSEADRVDEPVSLYAATKRSNELMAYTYSYLYGIPSTGLRFFTVYGPYGRPDMAYFMFTEKILAGEPIQVFNHGRMKRDFTYIDDITQAIVKLLPLAPAGEAFSGRAPSDTAIPHAIYNIGNNQPVELLEFIRVLESLLGKKAVLEMKPMQAGDVEITYADTSQLAERIGYHPDTTLEEGLKPFVDWYRAFFKK